LKRIVDEATGGKISYVAFRAREINILAPKTRREPLNTVLACKACNLIERILVWILKVKNAGRFVIGDEEVFRA
jgi:hypothetical protein